jgi:hypothetical protein
MKRNTIALVAIVVTIAVWAVYSTLSSLKQILEEHYTTLLTAGLVIITIIMVMITGYSKMRSYPWLPTPPR